jgi:hypothetical protein
VRVPKGALRATQIIGVVLVLVGLLFVVSPTLPMATVIYPERFWYRLYPDGTSDNPTLLTPGSTVTLTAELVYYDAQLGVQLPGTYLTWIVQVSIDGQTITLDGKGVNTRDARYATFVFEKQWTVPNVEGKSLTLTWTVIIRDENRNEVGRATTTTYARTPLNEPDGVFYVNGRDASQTTQIAVIDGKLDLRFTAIKYGEKIQSVYVEVWRGGSKVATVALTGANPTWTASYTLPSPGTYRLDGYFTWSGSSKPVQKMSIVAGWNEGSLSSPSLPLGLPQLLGIGLVVVGGALLLRRPR